MNLKPIAVYGSVSIYERKGSYYFHIGSYRFNAESLDEAYRIIDRYNGKDDEEC